MKLGLKWKSITLILNLVWFSSLKEKGLTTKQKSFFFYRKSQTKKIQIIQFRYIQPRICQLLFVVIVLETGTSNWWERPGYVHELLERLCISVSHVSTDQEQTETGEADT